MTLEIAKGTKEYLQLEVDSYDNFTGVEYLGAKQLLEYTVGDLLLKVINDSSAKNAQMKVSLTFTRRWFYHGVNVFLQSVLLLIVAYMTFYYRVDNFQVRHHTENTSDFYSLFLKTVSLILFSKKTTEAILRVLILIFRLLNEQYLRHRLYLHFP